VSVRNRNYYCVLNVAGHRATVRSFVLLQIGDFVKWGICQSGVVLWGNAARPNHHIVDVDTIIHPTVYSVHDGYVYEYGEYSELPYIAWTGLERQSTAHWQTTRTREQAKEWLRIQYNQRFFNRVERELL
jgi:hypothetical protein